MAQGRVDHGFGLSVLQGEQPNVGTLMKANALAKRMKSYGNFSLKFRPMELEGCGVMVVTDSSLGNVTKSGRRRWFDEGEHLLPVVVLCHPGRQEPHERQGGGILPH